MDFQQFRALLRVVSQQHSLRTKQVHGMAVLDVESKTEPSTGHVSMVRFIGDGWTKTFRSKIGAVGNDMYDRCIAFLDDLPDAEGVDPQDTQLSSSMAVLIDILTGEFGANCVEIGEAGDAENLNFQIPVSVLKKAIKEKNGESE